MCLERKQKWKKWKNWKKHPQWMSIVQEAGLPFAALILAFAFPLGKSFAPLGLHIGRLGIANTAGGVETAPEGEEEREDLEGGRAGELARAETAGAGPKPGIRPAFGARRKREGPRGRKLPLRAREFRRGAPAATRRSAQFLKPGDAAR